MSTAALVVVRDATEADGARLREMMRGSTEAAGVRWSVEPGADAFAALRAETDGWTVALAEDDQQRVVGFVSVATRAVVGPDGPLRSCYVTNLKVLPEHRGRGIGDALCWHAIDLCRRAGGSRVPILMVIRSGNAKMSRRVHGPRGLPGLARLTTVQVHSVPVHRAASIAPGHRLEMSEAGPGDLEEMAALAATVASERQFAPAMEASGLARRIEAAPGLDFSDHIVARSGGRIVGWIGWWDELALREVRISGFTVMGAARRTVQGVAARLTRARRPASVGDRVGCLRALQLCVPTNRPDVLRALIAESARRRAQDCSWLKIALDVRDPLAGAMRGLRSHVVAFDARFTTPSGAHVVPHADERPLHLDAALI